MSPGATTAQSQRQRIELELARLSSSDQLRLKRIAQLRALGIPALQWDDLLQEAITRLLSGARRCPNDVPIMACLIQTIRGIASDAREHEARMVEADGFRDEDGSPMVESIPSSSPDPESNAVTRHALETIEGMFADDPDAISVLFALAHGWTPEETVGKRGMTLKRYQSAQKRIRRKLASSESLGD